MSNVPAESGAQLVARISSGCRPTLENLCDDLFPHHGPLPGQVVEIGGESSTGKSHVLMEIMARAILPSEYGGRDAHVLFFDLDNKFKMTRFLYILEKIACASNVESAEAKTKEAIEGSLQNLVAFDCFTPDEYEMGQMQVEDLLASDGKASLVAVDSTFEFYWIDCKKATMKMETYLKKIVQSFRKLAQTWKVVVAYTRPAYFASAMDRVSSTETDSSDYRIRLQTHESEDEPKFEAELEFEGQVSKILYVIDNFGINFLKT